MGCCMRKYTGSSDITGCVVADGSTAGTCVVCTGATTEPLGVAVSVDPNGNVDIAGIGDRAFVYAGAAFAADSTNFACCDSNGHIIPRSPGAAETSGFQLGMVIRPQGLAIAQGELAEIMVNPIFMAVAAAAETSTVEEFTPAENVGG